MVPLVDWDKFLKYVIYKRNQNSFAKSLPSISIYTLNKSENGVSVEWFPYKFDGPLWNGFLKKLLSNVFLA